MVFLFLVVAFGINSKGETDQYKVRYVEAKFSVEMVGAVDGCLISGTVAKY